jgi:hypothetical protein
MTITDKQIEEIKARAEADDSIDRPVPLLSVSSAGATNDRP